MGSNCGAQQTPDTLNRCAIGVGEQYEMAGFCTYEGPAGEGYRNQYCALISNGGEWGDATAFESCLYNDCIPYTGNIPGCCQGCCSIIGEGLACTRKTFTGNPAQCCFNDLDRTGLNPTENPTLCYSDGSLRQNACDDGSGGHNYRNLVSPDCQDTMLQYCTGTLPTDNPNSVEWLNRWTTGGNRSCTYALVSNLFKSSGKLPSIPITTPGVCTLPPPLPIDSQGFFWSQRLMNETMSRYEENFNIGALPGSPGYNVFQDTLYSICCSYPGICSQGLESVCSTKTAQRISFNVAESNFCSCHLPEGEYLRDSVRFNIPPECSSICNRVGVLPIVGINGEPVTCKQSTCVIDNITLNLVNSTIGGGIDFNQVCQQCNPGAQCSCIISNNTFDIDNSTIGGIFLPVSQNCGNVTCQQTNPGPIGPEMISIPCGIGSTGGDNPYAEYQQKLAQEEARAKLDSYLWTLVAIAVSLFLLWLIIYLLASPTFGNKNNTINRQTGTFVRDNTNYNSILNR